MHPLLWCGAQSSGLWLAAAKRLEHASGTDRFCDPEAAPGELDAKWALPITHMTSFVALWPPTSIYPPPPWGALLLAHECLNGLGRPTEEIPGLGRTWLHGPVSKVALQTWRKLVVDPVVQPLV